MRSTVTRPTCAPMDTLGIAKDLPVFDASTTSLHSTSASFPSSSTNVFPTIDFAPLSGKFESLIQHYF